MEWISFLENPSILTIHLESMEWISISEKPSNLTIYLVRMVWISILDNPSNISIPLALVSIEQISILEVNIAYLY